MDPWEMSDAEIRDSDGRGYPRASLRAFCTEYKIDWTGLTSAEMVASLDGGRRIMAKPANVEINCGPEIFTYEGRRYGPGIATIPNTDENQRLISDLKVSVARVLGGIEAADEERRRQNEAVMANIQAQMTPGNVDIAALRDEATKIVDEARGQAAELINNAVADANEKAQTILDEARDKATEILNTLKADIAAQTGAGQASPEATDKLDDLSDDDLLALAKSTGYQPTKDTPREKLLEVVREAKQTQG